MWVQSLGWEGSLEEGMATHSSILVWRIPWTEEPGGLQSIGFQSRTRVKWLSMHALWLCIHVQCFWWWFSREVVSNSCDPVDYSLPCSSVHGILQARILEWVAISFSRGSCQPRNWSRVSFIAGRWPTELWGKPTMFLHTSKIILKNL